MPFQETGWSCLPQTQGISLLKRKLLIYSNCQVLMPALKEDILLTLGSFTDRWEGQETFASRKDLSIGIRQKMLPRAEELKIPKYSEATKS